MAKVRIHLLPPPGRVGWLAMTLLACLLVGVNSWLVKAAFPVIEKMLPKILHQVHAEQAALLITPLVAVFLELQVLFYFLQRFRFLGNNHDS
jgi:hypothetical protein